VRAGGTATLALTRHAGRGAATERAAAAAPAGRPATRGGCGCGDSEAARAGVKRLCHARATRGPVRAQGQDAW
jgi:hypothetical protein